MDSLTRRIVSRFLLSFKYEHKEKKEHKVERLMKEIRDTTGISKTQAEDIADAFIRGREVERLALQKGWPIEDLVVMGPQGKCNLRQLSI